MNDPTAGADQLLNMLGGGRQAKRLLRMSFPRQDGPQGVQMVANRLSAREALGQDFEFRVEVLADSPDIALKDVIGRMVTVTQQREDGSERHYNGYVFDFARVRDDAGFSYYDMSLLPWLAFLRFRYDNYLFYGMTVQQQTEDIFADYEMRDWEAVALTEDTQMTDACQYGESDYNYLHRRWEALGWTYWYEHTKDGHTLKLCGDTTDTAPLDGESPDVSWKGKDIQDRGMRAYSPVRAVASTHYAASSFDFKNPRPITADVPTLNQQGSVPSMEVYEYTGSYGFKNGEAGDALVRLRMQEIEAHGKHFEGSGDDDRLMPGRWFKLTDQGSPVLRAAGAGGEDTQDNEFLVVAVTHHASNNYEASEGGTATYSNDVVTLRRKVRWRPGRGRNSEEPRIYGLQTATVVGPEGEEIHTDEYGRVRVQFHWDRVGTFNEKSSAWVRVASLWAGSNFGFICTPRIGQEVLVQFLEGNPDRPMIVGRVYNQQNMPPWELPANKTQSGILSRSSQGGVYENANAFRFEDKKGSEQVWLHAERNQDIEVENDETHWVGHDRSKTIDNDETVHVKHNHTETVDNDETITVHNNRTERVDVNEKISIDVDRTEDVGNNETVSIGSNRTVTVGGNKLETVALAKAETIGLAKALTTGLAYQVTVGAAMNTTVALSQSQQVGISKHTAVAKQYTIEVGDELRIKVGKSTLVMKSDGTIIFNGHEFNVGTSGVQNFKAEENIVMKARKILEN